MVHDWIVLIIKIFLVITSSPVELCHVNVDSQCSAKMVNFNHSPKLHLWIIWFHILQGWLLPVDQHQVRLGSYQQGRPYVVVKLRVVFLLIFVFLFCLSFLLFCQTREPLSAYDSSKDVVWCKVGPSKQVYFNILKTPQNSPAVGKSQPK